jgi:hypothetical protein
VKFSADLIVIVACNSMFAWLIKPPANSTFLSEQTSHQQPVSSTFLSEQTNTSQFGVLFSQQDWKELYDNLLDYSLQ